MPPPPLSPRNLSGAPSSPALSYGNGGDNPRRLSQRQMVEMAFEGDTNSQPEYDYSDRDFETEATLSLHSSSTRNGYTRSNGDYHHPHATPSLAMIHAVGPSMDDESANLEQESPELFRQGILEQAERLGIDPRIHPELMWIARDSLMADLPEGWALHNATSTNSPYYYNAITGVSQWDHPTDNYFRQLADEHIQRIPYNGVPEDRLSSSEGMHTASFYEQNGGYSDATVPTAWHADYGATSDHLSYANADYHHDHDWRHDNLAATYDHGYEAQSVSTTQSSSKGYEEHSDLAVADTQSTIVASGREHYARGSGAASPSRAEFEALMAQVQELEQRNKELEDQQHQDRDRATSPTSEEVEAWKTLVHELEKTNKELEEQRLQDDELILKLETQMKILTDQGQNQTETDAQRLLLDEKEKLEATVVELRTAMAATDEQLQQMQSINSLHQKDLMLLQQIQRDMDATADEQTRLRAREIEEMRTEKAEEALLRLKLEEHIVAHREHGDKIATELVEARAVIEKLEGELADVATREQNEHTASMAAITAVSAADDRIHSLNAMLKELNENVCAAEAEANTLRNDICALKLEHARALETCSAEHLLQLATRDVEVEAKITELNTTNDALRVAVEEKAALQIRLDEQVQLAATLKAESDNQQRTLKRDIRVLERDLKALQLVSKEREDECTAAKGLVATLEHKLSEQDAIVAAAKRSAFEEAEKAANEVVKQVQAEKARIAMLYTQELQTRRRLHNRLMELQGNIRVFCRVRPIQAVEYKSEQSSPAVFFRENDAESLDLVVGGELGSDGKLLNGAGQKHPFEFDHVFQPDSSQNEVFEQTKALVTSALDGFNVCIFAYGQTGSGKTHTMEGSDADPGIYHRSLEELFQIREERTAVGDFECSMKLSMLEVYNETVVDLLDNTSSTGGLDQRKGLEIRMGKQGVYVENLIDVEVFNEKDVTDLMKLGKSHRSVGAHDFNEHSSRSHLVLSITIETFQKTENKRRLSKLHLIDLAGSERVSKTAASGQRLKEAQNINRSLSALGDVIAALGTNSKHVPYRNSKLTFLLQECLSGNSKVLMFVNISPVQWNAPETLCSLNFASRCRNVALGMAKASSSAGPDASSASPSMSKEPTRSVNLSTSSSSVSSTKQRPGAPSPSVKGTQRIVFG